MTEMILRRRWYSDQTTIGSLRFADFCCFTLEARARAAGVKVQDKTAIPAGIYKVIVNFSQRFQRPMPLLLDVPMFTGIRIHSGNCEYDTMGCILVGEWRGPDWVGDSRKAFNKLFPLIVEASEDLWMSVMDVPVTDTRTPDVLPEGP